MPYKTTIPNTAHSVFYSYTIFINGSPVGSLNSISSRSQRNAESIREVLFSAGAEINEIVWSGTDTTLDLNYTELYTQSLYEALGYDVYSIEDLNTSFDIQEQMRVPVSPRARPMPDPEEPAKIRTLVYHDCVPTSWGKTLDTGTARVVETMSVMVRTVTGSIE